MTKISKWKVPPSGRSSAATNSLGIDLGLGAAPPQLLCPRCRLITHALGDGVLEARFDALANHRAQENSTNAPVTWKTSLPRGRKK